MGGIVRCVPASKPCSMVSDDQLQYSNIRLAGLNSLLWSVWISRGAGLVLALDGGLILLPMLRNIIRIIRPKLTWLFPADENIWFHRQVAYSMAFWSMVHTTSHYVNFINVERTRTSPFPWFTDPKRSQLYRDSKADRSPDPLHSARRYHRSLHAPHHGRHVFHRACQDSKGML